MLTQLFVPDLSLSDYMEQLSGHHHTHHSVAGYPRYVITPSHSLQMVASFHVHLALGFLVDWTTSTPGGNFFAGVASQLGFAYYTVSVFLNTTLTCMICYRIVHHGRTVQENLGHEYASLYFAIVTIVVESVIPYTLSGIAFLVSLGMGSPTSVAFLCVYILMMVRGLAMFADSAGQAKRDTS